MHVGMTLFSKMVHFRLSIILHYGCILNSMNISKHAQFYTK